MGPRKPKVLLFWLTFHPAHLDAQVKGQKCQGDAMVFELIVVSFYPQT